MVKKALALFLLIAVCMSVVIVYRALTLAPSEQVLSAGSSSLTSKIAVSDDVVARLAGAVAISTSSSLSNLKERGEQFTRFHSYLREQYPLVHQELKLELINKYSLLYTWQGSNPELKPILLLSHQDVVPVEPGTHANWDYPPFAGAVADGYIWGRGAWDDKSTLIASLEAVETLLAEGRSPRRTVMLAFGHDEEIGGQLGAVATAKLLVDRGLEFALILDEGSTIQEIGVIPGVPVKTAMISVAEKGYVSLQLSVNAGGGHSSMPPPATAIGQLAEAVARLEATPLPASINEPIKAMYDAIGPHMPFKNRLVLANLWLFEPLLLSQMEKNRVTNAAIRTTTAPTIFRAGVKENVLPQSARATVNFRIAPGESSESVINHVRRVINNPSIEIRETGALSSEPTSVSSADGWGFNQVKRAILQVRPELVVAPTLLFGATDSRHYSHLSDQVFKFTPITYGNNDKGRIHGTNERISVDDIKKAVRFYYTLIDNSSIRAN